MKLRYLSLILLCGLFLSSCNKDREAPSITITSPTNNQVIAPGDTFSFVANVTDNEGLSTISFTYGSETENIASADFDDLLSHKLNYNITISADSDPGEFMITVNASDLENNTKSEDVTIVIQ